MIKTKFYIDEEGIEHKDLIVSYSDENLPIQENFTYRVYEDGVAIDPVNHIREYFEVKEEVSEINDDEQEFQDIGKVNIENINIGE